MHRSIVESNAAERQRLSELVAQLRDEDFGRVLEPGWTVAAALVHVAFWDRRISVLIDRWMKDGPSTSEVDLDATNDALLPQWRLIPPRAAVQELLAAMEEMDRKVEALPADLVAEIVGRKLGNIDRGGHRRAHREQIERSVRS
jgi:hypothetical protein